MSIRARVTPSVGALEGAGEASCSDGEVVTGLRTDRSDRHSQTATPEFQSWFGRSKVLDQNGEPLVMIHGTPYGFEAFRANKDGLWFCDKDSWEADVAILDEASSRGLDLIPSGDPDAIPSYPVGARILPVFLRIEHPFEMEDYPDTEALREAGHDGAIQRDGEGRIVAALVLDPRQVKSALGNCGAFDPTNPGVRS